MFIETSSNERLFSLYSSGDEKGKSELITRFYNLRHKHAYMVSPNLTRFMEEGEINYCCFIAMTKAFEKFRPMGGNFLNYYLTIFQHEICHKANEIGVMKFGKTVSIDAPIRGHDSELSLHEVIPGENMEDPKNYHEYVEGANSYSKLAESLEPIALDIARLRHEGYTYEEISKKTGLSIKKIRNHCALFSKLVREGIEVGSFENVLCKKKNRKILKASEKKKDDDYSTSALPKNSDAEKNSKSIPDHPSKKRKNTI
ncbi:MAG: hypothetical protein LKF75_00105 [Bacilli bacterium]|nr:hypothetical protein [Bacilli bacterium]MCH4228105.1 hypothetical protein [Bacilli bacterium]MCH4278168.1 hypothetical protein [Bacilli bacterium]